MWCDAIWFHIFWYIFLTEPFQFLSEPFHLFRSCKWPLKHCVLNCPFSGLTMKCLLLVLYKIGSLVNIITTNIISSQMLLQRLRLKYYENEMKPNVISPSTTLRNFSFNNEYCSLLIARKRILISPCDG